jgi:hypothetical protein
MQHRIDVAGRTFEVHAFKTARRGWIAVGAFNGVELECRGRFEREALIGWRILAERKAREAA